MADIDRRQFLKAAGVTGIAGLAGCTGGGGGGGNGGDGGRTIKVGVLLPETGDRGRSGSR
ncbi:MAG: twin-arginine translocation signal domain-containing protein [Halodesulfurarchaeum sp.]